MAEFTYAHQSDAINTAKVREIISGLPPYVSDFMRDISTRTTARTRVAYAYDLRVFIEYLHSNNSAFSEKEIIRLDVDEVAILLDNVESGENQTERQKKYNESFRTRDLAILTLLLGTGIRVSELVGLDLADVDYRNGSIMVYRKSGKIQEVYFSDEVEEALYAYMEEREQIEAAEGHSSALFLSSQKKRINVRTVEVLVKKYAETIGTNKHITPHKLRSTYGTALYHETGDIYLVADVLGHSDVNTTKKHYSAIQEDTRRSAKDKVRLRKD